MRRLLACGLMMASLWGGAPGLAAEPAADPAKVQALIRQARLQTIDGDLLKAKAQLTEALALAPDSREALRTRAQVLGTLKDYDGALADLNRVVSLYPGDAELKNLRGMFYAAIDKPELAMKDMDAAVAGAPANTYYLITRSEQKLYGGDTAGALADIDAAIAINPKDISLKARRLDLVKPQGGSDETAAEDRESLYTAQIAARPRDPYPYQLRGESRVQAGDLKGALADYSKALDLQPLPVRYAGRAAIYRAMGQPEKAETDLTASVRTDPFSISLLNRAAFYAATGKVDAWLADARAALDKLPKNDPEALAEVIYAALAKPDLDLALATANAWIAARPQDFDAFRLRSIVQDRRGNLDAAVADMARAVEAPDADEAQFLEASLSLADLQERKGDFKAAVAALEAARTEAPKNGDVLGALCRVKARGDIAPQSLLADCEAALALSPNDADTLDAMAFAHLRLDRNAEALAAYDKALARRPGEAKSLYGRAVAKERLGDKTMGQDASAALTVWPAVADAFSKVGLGLTNTIILDRPQAPDLTGQAAPTWLTAPTLAQFYPQRALDADREGVAQLSCTVGAQGNLANCSVVSETPDGFGFGQAALKAAQDARLSPTTINGVPVDGRPIQFRSRFALR